MSAENPIQEIEDSSMSNRIKRREFLKNTLDLFSLLGLAVGTSQIASSPLTDWYQTTTQTITNAESNASGLNESANDEDNKHLNINLDGLRKFASEDIEVGIDALAFSAVSFALKQGITDEEHAIDNLSTDNKLF